MTIVYKDNEGVKVIHTAPGYDYKIIADKDVPSGVSYVFVAEEDLPPGDTRAAWDITITESNRDGVGLTKEQFQAKYPDLKGWAVQ